MKKFRPKTEPKSFWKKLWYFLWKDDSLLSWLVNILIAFVLVKFLIYPGLGLVLQTDYPVVAVVSGSMTHEGLKFDSWWEQNQNWYLEHNVDSFDDFNFRNGFNKGDIMILHGVEPKDIKIGDVIVYSSSTHMYPIIHRVVEIDDGKFIFKGDNNPTQDPMKVEEEQILGRAQFRIPYLGYVKIWATDLFKLAGGL